jgi:hypothetical protein
MFCPYKYLKNIYSYLKASIGSKREAFLAG